MLWALRQSMKSLREPDRKALARLLADEDPRTLQLLQETLAGRGEEGILFLESVVRDGDPAAQRNATQILHILRETAAWEDMTRFCATCGSHFDLEVASWLVAKTRYPEMDKAAYTTRIDQMAQELRERLTGRETPRSTIEVCNHYLFRTLGFRGNRQDYYDPDNSYLNRVLDRRLGIPISLSVLYLLLARRLHLPLIGINMPAHFLLKWQSATTNFFFDPFHEGELLDEADCRELCKRLGVAFNPLFLTPTTPQIVLLRMCNNLQAIYAEREPARAEHFGRFAAMLSRM
jgi:regulator of sirC expression with transglutaminase-like and TPR domain